MSVLSFITDIPRIKHVSVLSFVTDIPRVKHIFVLSLLTEINFKACICVIFLTNIHFKISIRRVISFNRYTF